MAEKRIITIGRLNEKRWKMHNEVHSISGVCPCITGMGGGNTQPMILLDDDAYQTEEVR